jgi:hypothetical protein
VRNFIISGWSTDAKFSSGGSIFVEMMLQLSTRLAFSIEIPLLDLMRIDVASFCKELKC